MNQLLHDRAQKIRATMKDDAQAIIDSGTSPEQQNEAAEHRLLLWMRLIIFLDFSRNKLVMEPFNLIKTLTY